MKKFALAIAIAATSSVSANAAVIVNGGFESSPINPGGFTTLNAGNTNLTGWTISTGSIDYIGTHWQPGAGARSVDLNGGSQSGISQVLDTVVGQTYLVNFLLAGNPDGLPDLKILGVQASGSALQTYTFDATSTTLTAMGWIGQNYVFTAAGSSTTLTFNSLVTGLYGPALDEVSISAIPEPGTWALMMGGLALVGAQLRRRKMAVSFV